MPLFPFLAVNHPLYILQTFSLPWKEKKDFVWGTFRNLILHGPAHRPVSLPVKLSGYSPDKLANMNYQRKHQIAGSTYTTEFPLGFNKHMESIHLDLKWWKEDRRILVFLVRFSAYTTIKTVKHTFFLSSLKLSSRKVNFVGDF